MAMKKMSRRGLDEWNVRYVMLLLRRLKPTPWEGRAGGRITAGDAIAERHAGASMRRPRPRGGRML